MSMARSTRAAQVQLTASTSTPDTAAVKSADPANTSRKGIFGRHLTDEVRQLILQKREELPSWSQIQLAQWLEKEHGVKVNRTTIGRTLQKGHLIAPKAESVEAAPAESSDASKEPIHIDLEQAVYNWYLEKVRSVTSSSSSASESTPVLAIGVGAFKEKALELARASGYNSSFSDKWLQGFLKRFGLQVTTVPVSSENGEVPGDPAGTRLPMDSNELTAWPNELFTYLAPSAHEESTEENNSNEYLMEDQKANVMRTTRAHNETSGSLFGRPRSSMHLSEDMRKSLLKKHSEEPGLSQMQLSEWLTNTYGVTVHRATIGRNLKRLGGWVAESGSPAALAALRNASIRPASFVAFEKALHAWVVEETSSGKVIPDVKLACKAKDLAADPKFKVPETFNFNQEWRERFKSRYEIQTDKSLDESVVTSAPDSEASEHFDVEMIDSEDSEPLTMSSVHQSVNNIRRFVYGSELGQDKKRELMQGLDDIYIKLGEELRNVSHKPPVNSMA